MSEKGKIINYNPNSGTGFIKRDGKCDVHFGKDSFKGNPPTIGTDVQFDLIEQTQGPHAKNMTFISESSSEISSSQYKLPKDTRKIISIDNIDNFVLKLNKTSYFDSDENFKFFKMDKKSKSKLIDVRPKFSKTMIESIAGRYKKNLKISGLKIEAITYDPVWKMALGLGNESVYETSMTLHHIYGIPYIPGSALKGVIRSHIIKEIFGKNIKDELDLKNAEEKALQDQGFCDIFGCPKKKSYYQESRQGKIIFFDALPVSLPNIKPDVMNPHYAPYYSDTKGKTPPADYHNPVPIFFLTVEKTQFEFIIGVKEKSNHKIQTGKFMDKNLFEETFEWMKKGLKEHGIGAKTAVGYGYFQKNGLI
jgi:CRISPR-associated protein Cmr6